MLPFISTEDLGAYLDEDLSGPPALLTDIALDSGCQMVRDEIGQDINLTRGRIETHDGNGRESILLRQLPVIDVGSITEDETELTLADDYTVDLRTGMIHRVPWSRAWWGPGWYTTTRQNVIVIYDSGWAITEEDVVDESSGDEPVVDHVPSPIRVVALQAAARIFRAPTLAVTAASVGTGAVTSETIGGYSYTTDTTAQAEIQRVIMAGLSEEEKRSLDHYRPGA